MEPMLRFKADDGSEFPDWEEKTLGELGCFCSGVGFSERYQGHANLPVDVYKVSDMNISGNEKEMLRANNTVDESILKKMKTKAIDQPSIIFAKVGAAIFAERKRIARKPFIVDNNMMVFTPNDENDFEYIYWLTLTLRFASRVQIGALPSYNASDISGFVVNIPSLPEQRKIADLLSAVDDVIAAQEAEVVAWEKRKKGVMQKLFSQEVRFKADDGSDFPDWEEKTLGDICMYERQRSEGANFVGTENMLKDFGGVTFDNSNADGSGTLYHPGDTLMSNIRPYLKKAWLADRKGTCSTDVLVFHPTSVEPGYLYWLIASDAFVRYVMSAAKGSKMPRGDKKHIMEMPLLLPNKDEQRKIDDCLSSLNDVIIKAKNELAKWQELKKGLLQQMFV